MHLIDGSTEPTRQERESFLYADLARFPAELFQFDPRLASGWLSDRYFVRTANTLRHAGRDPRVTMQVFAKETGTAAGIWEVLRMLQTQLAPGYTAGQITVDTLLEGERFEEWETVMFIAGPYRAFAHLETDYLGVLARRTKVASATRAVAEAAGGKPVIFMPARHDDWRVQVPDGYAALRGGAASVSTDANGAWWGTEGVGTMPHALIAAYGGDTVEATLAFTRYVRAEEPGVRIISLVDFDNDVIGTSLAVARAMREEFGAGELAGVRIDTSERLIDRSLIDDPEVWGREHLNGVNPTLVRRLRAALDQAGFPEVGIVASGGFDAEKIRRFEALGLPVAAYGVGSSLIAGSHDFTADIVEVDGSPLSKVGRARADNPRLVRLDWARLAAADGGELINAKNAKK
jgi:nicotinate phosphoribosyltransferase